MVAAALVEAFFDEPTNTVSYLVVDPQTHRAAVVDPVLDYDQRTGKASAKSADRIIDRATVLGAAIDWVLET
ncbi:MAG: MBL fold metallo-hydrolase, partial [Aestuariivirga sp.]